MKKEKIEFVAKNCDYVLEYYKDNGHYWYVINRLVNGIFIYDHSNGYISNKKDLLKKINHVIKFYQEY